MTFERIDQIAARVLAKSLEASANGHRDNPELDDRKSKRVPVKRNFQVVQQHSRGQ